jgi:hypothetical protein
LPICNYLLLVTFCASMLTNKTAEVMKELTKLIRGENDFPHSNMYFPLANQILSAVNPACQVGYPIWPPIDTYSLQVP